MIDLEVVHETRYAYVAPVSLAHHLACLKPLDDMHQRRLGFALDIDPPPAQCREGSDHRGNTCHWFTLAVPHDRLLVRAASRVRVVPRFAGLVAEGGPAWDAQAERLRYVAQGAFDPAVEFTMPSRYVPRLEGLRRYAAPSFPPGRPVAAAAVELMHRIHADFRFDTNSTHIDTPLVNVLAKRAGVCQDFAHLMIGALRMVGVPARYASGYLLTRPPDGEAPMVGADASHAWVQVYCPGTPGVPADGWLGLDPTNDVVPGVGHVRVALGRDFGDITPLRGVIRGGGSHTLTVGVSTRVVSPAGGTGGAPSDGPFVANV